MGLFGVRYSANQPSELPPPPSMAEAIKRAYQARPELAALEAQRLAQELQIKSLKLNKKPDLIGAASVSALGPIIREDIFIPLFPNYSAQLILSIPLYDGGAMSAQIALARAELRSIDAQMAQLKLDVSRSIEDAYTTYQAAVAARIATEEATKFAIENEELAKGRYNAGAGSAIEISDAEVALVQAKSFELQARATEGLARLQIEFVLGVLQGK
jgi:outer membrane protein